MHVQMKAITYGPFIVAHKHHPLVVVVVVDVVVVVEIMVILTPASPDPQVQTHMDTNTRC